MINNMYRILFLLCFPMLFHSQETNWGIGIINFPETEQAVSIYNAPQGNEIGFLELSNYGSDSNPVALNWRNQEGISLRIPSSALMEIGYEEQGLVVLENKDGFIRVFDDNGQQSQWLSLEKLRENGFEYLPWIRFMVTSDRSFLPMFYGMNVRNASTAAASLLVLAKGEQFEITPTGKVNGLWAEVIVQEFDSVYCEMPHNLLNTYTGWIKILDDAGYPNIWFYARGC
ncbi:hypothetical protein ACOCEA_03865 [Maribacter sp. CXY002]|uniref:hypothetical protein n=1 Tax=Maribacter luteocoastalis TaxID=3407671 RepID=UPI003B6702EA